MKKSLATRLNELETMSKKLCAEEHFDAWLSERYPDKSSQLFDYMTIMPNIPPEFRDVCLERVFQEMRNLQNSAPSYDSGISDND